MLVLDDKLAVLAHAQIHFATRARNIITWRFPAAEHGTRIAHLFAVDAVRQTLRERVAAEVAPEIPTAPKHPAVPVELRIVPQLMACGRKVFRSVPSLELVTIERLPAGLRADELPVANWREFRVPGQLRAEVHPEFVRHFARNGNFMLVVTKDDKLPGETRNLGSILLLMEIDPFDVADHLVKIAREPGIFGNSPARRRRSNR